MVRGALRAAGLVRWIVWIILGLLSLQVFFLVRVVLMNWIDPQSTSFERSAIYQIATTQPQPWQFAWRQNWVPYERIGKNLKRAIIAAEDATFTEHDGVDWNAIERAWEKNKRQEEAAERAAERLAQKNKAKKPSAAAQKNPVAAKPPKTVGGSTITQQLAKNLFLSGERTYIRKAQEYALVLMLETLLSKQRIYEIYLNNVEWGEGIFGAEAAARYYFRKSAAQLSDREAALLAVMLPRPKYFERRIRVSEYLQHQASVVQGRMGAVEIP